MTNRLAKCLIVLLALLALTLPAFAQLPTTCDFAIGSSPRHIVATTGSLTYSVTNATWSSGTATLTIGANSLSIGNVVIVSGVAQRGGTAPSGYNGQVTLTGETTTTISYAVPVNPGTFTASTGAQVYYPGLTYYGICTNGVVYQVPIYGTAVNNAAVQPTTVGPSTTYGQVQPLVCHAQYSYANDGGANGTITPTNGCTIPAKSVVINSIIYVATQVAGTSCTLSVGWGSSGNVASLLALTSLVSTNTTFEQSLIVPQTASGWIRVTTATPVTVTLAACSTSASSGIVDVYVYYVTLPE